MSIYSFHGETERPVTRNSGPADPANFGQVTNGATCGDLIRLAIGGGSIPVLFGLAGGSHRLGAID